MNTKHFSRLLGQFFFNFQKSVGDTFPLLPANDAPDTPPDIHMYPENNSTSQKHFNNSVKIAAESVHSPAIRTVLHMSTLTNITKILKQSLKIKKKTTPTTSQLLTTVKIVKKLMQAEKV